VQQVGRFGTVALLLVTVLGAGAAGARAPVPVRSPLRVLFIGNSYTRFNELPSLVAELAASDPAGPSIEVAELSRAGAHLETHFRSARTRREIATGGYTHVVLQDHSLAAFRRPHRMRRYARELGSEVDRSGARTVLFETWPRSAQSRAYRRGLFGHTPQEMWSRIDAAYREVATPEATLAPVGAAFIAAAETAPDLRLYLNDGAHPTPLGSYLAACVLYGALAGRGLGGLDHAPPHVAAEDASRLRAVADATLWWAASERASDAP
jgi:hypothetical protein